MMWCVLHANASKNDIFNFFWFARFNTSHNLSECYNQYHQSTSPPQKEYLLTTTLNIINTFCWGMKHVHWGEILQEHATLTLPVERDQDCRWTFIMDRRPTETFGFRLCVFSSISISHNFLSVEYNNTYLSSCPPEITKVSIVCYNYCAMSWCITLPSRNWQCWGEMKNWK